MENNKVSKITNYGYLKKRLKTTSTRPSTSTPPKVWNVKEILDARIVMVTQVETKLNGLLAKKDSLSPTIRL
jgi:hypothetical protein